MLNTGKESYYEISAADDKLLAAIGDGFHKHKIRRRRRIIRNSTAAAAVFVLLLFGCANIPVLYTHACEIPIVRNFVQAMRIGSGGKAMDDVTADISADASGVTISFYSGGEKTKNVLAYSAQYFHAPERLQMTFSGMDAQLFAQLKQKLAGMKAVRDIYKIQPLRKNEFSFVIVLGGVYQYELMEFSNPGTLTLRFYQDAYYTAEEKHPGDIVYFLRTDEINSGRAMKKMLKKFEAEGPSQIRNAKGTYMLVIGEYATRREAELAHSRLAEKYGLDMGLYVDAAAVENVPQAEPPRE